MPTPRPDPCLPPAAGRRRPPLWDEQVRRSLLVALARGMRRANAAATGAALGARPARRALAGAITAMLPPDGTMTRLAELRLFTRLSLGECADVLRTPRDLLRRRWRDCGPGLFQRARLLLG